MGKTINVAVKGLQNGGIYKHDYEAKSDFKTVKGLQNELMIKMRLYG